MASSNVAPTVTDKTDGSGLNRNLAGALSYLLGLITGIVFFVVDSDDAFVRFHAAQSIVFSLTLFVVSLVVSIVTTILVGIVFAVALGGGFGAVALVTGIISLFWLVFALGALAAWLYLMYKAYRGESPRLPVVGRFAERLAE